MTDTEQAVAAFTERRPNHRARWWAIAAALVIVAAGTSGGVRYWKHSLKVLASGSALNGGPMPIGNTAVRKGQHHFGADLSGRRSSSPSRRRIRAA